jgi:hypothetical protein
VKKKNVYAWLQAVLVYLSIHNQFHIEQWNFEFVLYAHIFNKMFSASWFLSSTWTFILSLDTSVAGKLLKKDLKYIQDCKHGNLTAMKFLKIFIHM